MVVVALATVGATQVALTLALLQHAMFLYASLCPVHTLGEEAEVYHPKVLLNR